MSFQVKSEIIAEKVAMRDAFCDTLIALAEKKQRYISFRCGFNGGYGHKAISKGIP